MATTKPRPDTAPPKAPARPKLPRAAHAGPIGLVEIAGERTCRHRDVADATLEEVSGERGLGQAEELRSRVQGVHLHEEVAKPRQVGRVFPLSGRELRHSDLDGHTYIKKAMLDVGRETSARTVHRSDRQPS